MDGQYQNGYGERPSQVHAGGGGNDMQLQSTFFTGGVAPDGAGNEMQRRSQSTVAGGVAEPEMGRTSAASAVGSQNGAAFILGDADGAPVAPMEDTDDDDDGTILSVPKWLFWCVLVLMVTAMILLITLLSLECCGSSEKAKKKSGVGERAALRGRGQLLGGADPRHGELATATGGGGRGTHGSEDGLLREVATQWRDSGKLEDAKKEEISKECGKDGASKWGQVKKQMDEMVKAEMSPKEKVVKAFVIAEACYGEGNVGPAAGTKEQLVEKLTVPAGGTDDTVITELFPPVTGAVGIAETVAEQAWAVIDSFRNAEGGKLADSQGVKDAVNALAGALKGTSARPDTGGGSQGGDGQRQGGGEGGDGRRQGGGGKGDGGDGEGGGGPSDAGDGAEAAAAAAKAKAKANEEETKRKEEEAKRKEEEAKRQAEAEQEEEVEQGGSGGGGPNPGGGLSPDPQNQHPNHSRQHVLKMCPVQKVEIRRQRL
ncbi:unnamed protein product [Amoebophrya sp. A25]|nr:unnamed protein product [Amoebophrya sp. A25]|eukprot:GSA25T00027155001.1